MTGPARAVPSELGRFVVAGLGNTGVSLLAYWALLYVMPYGLAYTVGYVAGVLSAFVLNTYFVFRVPWSTRKLLAFPAVHMANYAFGLLLLWVFVTAGVPEAAAPLLVIPATIPFNFVLSRLLMRRGVTSAPDSGPV